MTTVAEGLRPPFDPTPPPRDAVIPPTLEQKLLTTFQAYLGRPILEDALVVRMNGELERRSTRHFTPREALGEAIDTVKQSLSLNTTEANTPPQLIQRVYVPYEGAEEPAYVLVQGGISREGDIVSDLSETEAAEPIVPSAKQEQEQEGSGRIFQKRGPYQYRGQSFNLTPREVQVLNGIMADKSVSEVADEMIQPGETIARVTQVQRAIQARESLMKILGPAGFDFKVKQVKTPEGKPIGVYEYTPKEIDGTPHSQPSPLFPTFDAPKPIERKTYTPPPLPEDLTEREKAIRNGIENALERDKALAKAVLNTGWDNQLTAEEWLEAAKNLLPEGRKMGDVNSVSTMLDIVISLGLRVKEKQYTDENGNEIKPRTYYRDNWKLR